MRISDWSSDVCSSDLITDRVITSGAVEMIDGVDYSVARPRNVGQATLKGIELSTQYFLDFLPGALSGLGVQGAFTLADSKVGGDDTLAGYPLQDRQSVVEGKSVSVCVYLGGRRNITKQ